MEARPTRRGISAGVTWGGLGVLAWAAFTVLAGGGSAHASEHDNLLDGVTGLMSDTVSAVTAPVTPVVTQVVAPVVTAVVAPVQQAAPVVVAPVAETPHQVPVAAPVVTPVVQTVTETVQAVVAPVSDALQAAPVSQITDPIVDAVEGLPVVGRLVEDLGVTDLVQDVVGVVDDTADLVGGVVDETLPPVVEALEPQSPASPVDAVEPGAASDSALQADAVLTAIPAGALTTVTPAELRTGGESLDHAPPQGHESVDSTVSLAGSMSPHPAAMPPGDPLSPISSAGPAGGSTSAIARVSDDDANPLRAWKRVSGASDDVLPTSTVADTDVAPD